MDSAYGTRSEEGPDIIFNQLNEYKPKSCQAHARRKIISRARVIGEHDLNELVAYKRIWLILVI